MGLFGNRKATRADREEADRQKDLDKQARCTAERARLRQQGVQGWPTNGCGTACGPIGQRPCSAR